MRKSSDRAGEVAALDLEALDEGAEHDALREGGDAPSRSRSHDPRTCWCSASRKRNSKATPRNTSASSMTGSGNRRAGMMIAKASGKAASRPRPPSTSQVSLPSQIGAIEFITMLRDVGIGREAVEHADAEIEAVEQHVEEDAERRGSASRSGTKSSDRVMAIAPPPRRGSGSTGRLAAGRFRSASSRSSAARRCPARTSRAISMSAGREDHR